MKDLSRLSGLPLALDPQQGRLVFQEGLPPVEPVIQGLDQLRPELMNPEAEDVGVVAYRYPEVGVPDDRPALESGGLRYELTVLRPGMLGPEFAKTPGHRYEAPDGRGVPGVLEWLYGTGLLLLQGQGESPDVVADAVLIEPAPGDKVVVPPGYGYTAINLGRQPVVLASLTARDAVPVAQPYRKLQGAAYYATLDEQSEPVLVANDTYSDLPELRMLPIEALPDVELGLVAGTPLYRLAVARPEQFDYLSAPEARASLLELPILDDPDGDEDGDE